MIVDASHRNLTRIYSHNAYRHLAERCVGEASRITAISAVVVCGSVVKETIIPDWSDLDLIFFIEGFEKLDSLYQVRDALLRAKCDTEIGIGVDTVFHDEFRKTRKVGGRPLAMTFEVAGYGQTWYGKNPFAVLEFDSEAQQRVANEKVLLFWQKSTTGAARS